MNRWYFGWVVLGCLAALGSLTVGVIALGPALVIAAFLASRPEARPSAFGLLTGVGLPLVLVAWIQREGDHVNPLPWLIAGIVLCSVGLIANRWVSAKR